MLAGASAGWLSCWETIRDCATAVGASAGAGIAVSGVPPSTGDKRESAAVGAAAEELRMAASRCCNVFMPVLEELELLASAGIWRGLLDAAGCGPEPQPIGGLPLGG